MQQVSLSDIPEVFARLESSSSYPAFAVFIFAPPDRPASADSVNIQFSMEDRRPGFDWVLLSPTNIEDRARFLEFAESKGYEAQEFEMNNVRYLRIENGDLVQLCSDVISEMYGLQRSEPIALIAEGFSW